MTNTQSHIERFFQWGARNIGFALMLILTIAAQSTMAQTVAATIAAGIKPRAVGINPVTNKI